MPFFHSKIFKSRDPTLQGPLYFLLKSLLLRKCWVRKTEEVDSYTKLSRHVTQGGLLTAETLSVPFKWWEKIIKSITDYLKPQSQHEAVFLQNDILASTATLFSSELQKVRKKKCYFHDCAIFLSCCLLCTWLSKRTGTAFKH